MDARGCCTGSWLPQQPQRSWGCCWGLGQGSAHPDMGDPKPSTRWKIQAPDLGKVCSTPSRAGDAPNALVRSQNPKNDSRKGARLHPTAVVLAVGWLHPRNPPTGAGKADTDCGNLQGRHCGKSAEPLAHVRLGRGLCQAAPRSLGGSCSNPASGRFWHCGGLCARTHGCCGPLAGRER